MTIVIGIANSLGGVLGTLTIERFGRTFNMKYGALIQGLSFGLLNLGIWLNSGWLPIVAVVLYMLAFAVGFGGTMVMYCAEIIPAVGLGMAVAIQYLASTFIGWVVPHFEDAIGATGFIYIFMGWNIFAYLYVQIFCVETKGLTELEIAKKYEKKSK
jgi:hypothetical protein